MPKGYNLTQGMRNRIKKIKAETSLSDRAIADALNLSKTAITVSLSGSFRKQHYTGNGDTTFCSKFCEQVQFYTNDQLKVTCKTCLKNITNVKEKKWQEDRFYLIG